MTDSLSGRGRLLVGDVEHEALYTLSRSTVGGLDVWTGAVDNECPGVSLAFAAGRATLVLEDGRRAPIIVTKWRPTDSYSDIQVASAFTSS